MGLPKAKNTVCEIKILLCELVAVWKPRIKRSVNLT